MATWYCDYEGGADSAASAGNGDSFATRRKKLDNFSGAVSAGETIRVMASPDPVSIGNATWTNGPLPATVSIVSSTNASPIVLEVTGHSYSTGDTAIVNGHTTNTKANGVWEVTVVDANHVSLDGSTGNGVGGASGTVRKVTNAVVRLASGLTQNVACNGNRGTLTNWTASTNVTCTVETADFKEGGECQQIAVAAGFTTGKAAYLATGTLDLSGYTALCFWIKQTSGTVGANSAISLKLCSDTAGDTAVNTINVPTIGATSAWMPVCIDTGAALGSSIQSIALYVNTDNGAQTFRIDNVIASNGFNTTSLISKNTGDEPWFSIQSVNGTRVMLDGINSTIPTTSPARGYYGTTETAATYRREAVKTIAAAGTSTNVQITNFSGSAGSKITISGGWNRTDMSTQTGETWFDGRNGLGWMVGDSTTARSYLHTDKLYACRYNGGLSYPTTNNFGHSIGMLKATAVSTMISAAVGSVETITEAHSTGASFAIPANCHVAKIVSHAASTGVTPGTLAKINEAYIYNYSSIGCSIGAGIGVEIGYLAAKSNGTSGISVTTGSALILGGETSGNMTNGVSITTGGTLRLRDFTIGESTEVSGFGAFQDARVYSEKHDGTADNSQIFCEGGLISKQSSVVHGSATYAWRFSPTSTNRSEFYPLNLPIARVACAASSLVTISAWFQRDNTGLTGQLVCKGKQINGVSSDVTATMTAGANTWEELTITFTPTEAGVVEIEAQFYGGSTYNGYVSDMSISQA